MIASAPDRDEDAATAPGYPSTQASTAAAKATTAVPAAERQVYDAWMAWSHHERFDGRKAVEDYAKPALLNRLDWYSSHNWKVAYPDDPKIYAPDQVPNRKLPSEDIGDGSPVGGKHLTAHARRRA